ncbi:unnamed protein product [Urochloa humidicola]
MPTTSKSSDAGDGSGSTSILTATSTATGCHEFLVQGYSQLRGVGSNWFINSDEFNVANHVWCIRYFPDGYGEENKDWACFALHLVRPASEGDIEVEFDINLISKEGEETVPPYKKISSRCTFSKTKNSWWGFFRFIKREDLDSSFLKDDCFCISCHVTIFNEEFEEFVVPQSDLHRHLGDLLASGVGGDVTFDVGSHAVVAHKYLLAARSSIFREQFFGPLKLPVNRVWIVGTEARMFKAMLHFIYTDSLPEIASDDKVVMTQLLIVAADRYKIERLKLICESMLCTCISTSTAASTLVLAEKHGCQGLKQACFKFFKSHENFKAMADDYYLSLKKSCPSLLNELRAVHGLPPLSTSSWRIKILKCINRIFFDSLILFCCYLLISVWLRFMYEFSFVPM